MWSVINLMAENIVCYDRNIGGHIYVFLSCQIYGLAINSPAVSFSLSEIYQTVLTFLTADPWKKWLLYSILYFNMISQIIHYILNNDFIYMLNI